MCGKAEGGVRLYNQTAQQENNRAKNVARREFYRERYTPENREERKEAWLRSLKEGAVRKGE